jgi:DNA helicase-2/ATP-dependent DNA helicase PcrA
MKVIADLHVHSRFSRATARNLDLPNMALWARKKGLRVVGTGDFTHPGWRAELREGLEEAEPGLLRLRDGHGGRVGPPAACEGPVSFVLSAEVSTIYKKGERTRKVHHVVLAPHLDGAEEIARRLARIGNLASDGRPILGLDSRDLLEIVLESGEGCALVPAHIWTPWFSALGSKSGFDSIDECYGDLAGHLFAVETGLSSDPAMNHRVSSLDRFRLVSCSDAHSPAVLGREATVFDLEPSYEAMMHALRTGEGYVGTVEMFPEEGKYHADGHRRCGVRLDVARTRELGGRCPACGGRITVGVLHRVEDLASADERPPPSTAGRVSSLVPLREVLSEISGVGPKSKTVAAAYERLLAGLGPELSVLTDVPLEDVRRAGSELLAEAVGRLRRGQVVREAGYDGEYGVIRLFEDGELDARTRGDALFALPRRRKRRAPRPSAPAATSAGPGDTFRLTSDTAREARTGAGILGALDPEQRAAAEHVSGPLMVVAGPGSGKTRTLTHRIAHLVCNMGVEPESCLAVTFTRRAAREMTGRLEDLLGERGRRVCVQTFHGLGLTILREHGAHAGVDPRVRVASERELLGLIEEGMELTPGRARRLLGDISRARRMGRAPRRLAEPMERYDALKRARNVVDFDDLVSSSERLLATRPEVAAALRRRFAWVSVDEFQDVDATQYGLLTLLVPFDGNICVIGDADQAIYSFRGSDLRFFRRFAEDHPSVRTVRLTRNYRCVEPVVRASCQVIGGAGSQSVPGAGARVAIHRSPTERAEAEHVVSTIEGLLGGHSFFSIDSGRGGGAAAPEVGFSDIAVLTRTDALADPVAEALARSGMPFARRSHVPLTDVPGVQEVLDRLEPEDSGMPVTEALRRIAGCAGEELRSAVEMLVPLARRHAADAAGFVEEAALALACDAWDPRAERVTLMTLHASKGLQFRVVFIVGCEDSILPLRWGGGRGPDEEEERRLLYVGMTRAMDRLYLSHAERRRVHGQVRPMAPSPFLEAIAEELVERTRPKERLRPRTVEQLALFDEK